MNSLYKKSIEIITRLGVVSYVGIVILTLCLSAIGYYVETSLFSIAFFGAVLCTLLSIFLLEFARRLFLYIATGQNLLKNPTPVYALFILKGLKYSFTILIVLGIIDSVIAFAGYAESQKLKKRLREDAISVLPEKRAKLDELLKGVEECKKKNAPKPFVSSMCRQDKLSYNACAENGLSRNFCLSLHDYETSCKPIMPANISLSELECDAPIYKAKEEIKELESYL